MEKERIEELLEKCKNLLASKSHDYTTSHRHQNFDRQRELTSWFKDPFDAPYVNLIGVKLARLAVLLGHKEPKHESLEDTFVDLVNYCLLWADARLANQKEVKIENSSACWFCGLGFKSDGERVHSDEVPNRVAHRLCYENWYLMYKERAKDFHTQK